MSLFLAKLVPPRAHGVLQLLFALFVIFFCVVAEGHEGIVDDVKYENFVCVWSSGSV